MELVKKTFLLKKDDNGEFWQILNTRNGDDICNEILRDYFDIPENVTRIVISLHDRSTKNRVRAMIGSDCCGYPAVHVGPHCISALALDRPLKPLIGRTAYVDIEYME